MDISKDERAFRNVFNEHTVADLAAAIREVYPPFDAPAFLARVFSEGWGQLELKQRMRHITLSLRPYLPGEYRDALAVLRATLPLLTEQNFEKMVFPDFVEVHGLDEPEASLEALESFTQDISAEFAIRPFINRYPERTMAQMRSWAAHPHPGVRRLASEGCRPRLPWGVGVPGLKTDPAPILPILERLKADPDDAVRNSVANNLNDISKDHPDLVVGLIHRWQAEGLPRSRLQTQALRTLVKQGNPAALALLGYEHGAEVVVRNLSVLPSVVPMGGSTTVSFVIESEGTKPQDLVIDLVVYLMRANGRQTPKVFKGVKRRLGPGETLKITRQVSFAPVTTRVYYTGAHAVAPQINGQVHGRAEFVLSQA